MFSQTPGKWQKVNIVVLCALGRCYILVTDHLGISAASYRIVMFHLTVPKNKYQKQQQQNKMRKMIPLQLHRYVGKSLFLLRLRI